jgi:hypothetical protein
MSFWKRKPTLNELTGQALLDRAHKIGVRFTDISGGTGDLAERLALSQFGPEKLRDQIREKELELDQRQLTRLKKTSLIVTITLGLVTILGILINVYLPVK